MTPWDHALAQSQRHAGQSLVDVFTSSNMYLLPVHTSQIMKSKVGHDIGAPAARSLILGLSLPCSEYLLDAVSGCEAGSGRPEKGRLAYGVETSRTPMVQYAAQ